MLPDTGSPTTPGPSTTSEASPVDPPSAEPVSIAHFLVGRCNPESSNGVDKAIFHLSRIQAALGQRVGVFSVTDKDPIPIPGVDVRTYAPVGPRMLATLPGRLGDLALNRSPLNLPAPLRSELLAWGPTVAHFHFVHVPQSIRLAREVRKAGIPYCVSLHGGLTGAARDRRRIAKIAFAALFERRYLDDAAFVHAISSADVEGAAAFGVSNRFVVAPNCIDPAEFPGGALDREAIRGRFPRFANKRAFLYVGRLDPEQKGLDVLLRSWARVVRAPGTESALVIAGPDWRMGRKRLEELVTRLGLQDSVAFAGPVSGNEKWSLLAAADVFVHPSRWEAGIPFAVLEALLASTPVVLTDAADPDRVVDSSGAGFLGEPDPDVLEIRLLEAARMPLEALRGRGAAGRRLVEEGFRWEATAGRLIREYQLAAHRG